MYLGVPIRSKGYMFGDNKAIVKRASMPICTLSHKSTLASYHRVREAIPAGYQLERWEIQPCKHSQQTLEACKNLASPEASASIECSGPRAEVS